LHGRCCWPELAGRRRKSRTAQMRRNVKQARETMALTRVAIGVGDALSASWRGVPHFWQEMLVLELRNHAPGSLSPASLIVSEQRSTTNLFGIVFASCSPQAGDRVGSGERGKQIGARIDVTITTFFWRPCRWLALKPRLDGRISLCKDNALPDAELTRYSVLRTYDEKAAGNAYSRSRQIFAR
jgi:hypothetical protein